MEIPSFKTEAEEAEWWDSHLDLVADAFEQAAASGTLMRSPMRSKFQVEAELSLLLEAAPRFTRDEIEPLIGKLIELNNELKGLEECPPTPSSLTGLPEQAKLRNSDSSPSMSTGRLEKSLASSPLTLVRGGHRSQT